MTDTEFASAWAGYTAEEMKAHKANGLPVWHASMVRRSRHAVYCERKVVSYGFTVYVCDCTRHLVRSDLSAPTESGLLRSIASLKADGWWED